MGYTLLRPRHKELKDILVNEVFSGFSNLKKGYNLSKTNGGFWFEGYNTEDEHFIYLVLCGKRHDGWFYYKIIDGVDSFGAMPKKYLKMLDLSVPKNKKYYDYAMFLHNKEKEKQKNYPKYSTLNNETYLSVIFGTDLKVGSRKLNKGDRMFGIWVDDKIILPSINAKIKKNQIKRVCSKVEVLEANN